MRQFDSDVSTERVRRFREQKKQPETVSETFPKRDETVSETAPEEIRGDKNTEERREEVETPLAPLKMVRPNRDSMIAASVERMYALHPKKKNLCNIPDALTKAVASESDPSKKLSEIEKCHAAWCQTEEWTEKNGYFATKLDEWIADQGYTKWPQGFGRDSPAPKRRNSEELDEKSLALKKRLAEEWRRDHPNAETERHPAE